MGGSGGIIGQMKELLQFPPEFATEATIDEEVDGGIESHQQVGNLKWKMMMHLPMLFSTDDIPLSKRLR